MKCVAAWRRLEPAVAPAATRETDSSDFMQDRSEFSVGPLTPLDGGDGEALTASGTQIATLGAMQATWWVDSIPHTVALPNIPVRGARWSTDGTAIFAGTGAIDVVRGTWSEHPAFYELVQPGPPGEGCIVIQATSWSQDGRHAAVLLGWSGPEPLAGPPPLAKAVVLDLTSGAASAPIPAAEASSVRIVGDRVVIAAPVVRVWTLDGVEVSALPARPNAPLALSGGDDGGLVLLIDADWSIRVVDAVTWTVQAIWSGPFLDAVAVPGGVVAVDFEGKLHGGCLATDRLREVGAADTGVPAAHLAATGDGRIVIMGAGAVPVYASAFRLRCTEG